MEILFSKAYNWYEDIYFKSFLLFFCCFVPFFYKLIILVQEKNFQKSNSSRRWSTWDEIFLCYFFHLFIFQRPIILTNQNNHSQFNIHDYFYRFWYDEYLRFKVEYLDYYELLNCCEHHSMVHHMNDLMRNHIGLLAFRTIQSVRFGCLVSHRISPIFNWNNKNIFQVTLIAFA